MIPASSDTVVLFDLDGTVTDSYPGISRSFLHALDVIGKPVPSAEFLQSIVGPPLVDSLLALGYDDETAAAGVRAYRQRYDVTGWLENSVYPGMDELLADLAATGRRMALATSKNQQIARNIVEHFELADHFEYIGGADDTVGRIGKESVVRHVLDALAVDPVTTAVVMVGDRSHDVDGAAACRIPTIGVRWGYAHAGELEAAVARTGGLGHDLPIVESVERLRKVLGV